MNRSQTRAQYIEWIGWLGHFLISSLCQSAPAFGWSSYLLKAVLFPGDVPGKHSCSSAVGSLCSPCLRITQGWQDRSVLFFPFLLSKLLEVRLFTESEQTCGLPTLPHVQVPGVDRQEHHRGVLHKYLMCTLPAFSFPLRKFGGHFSFALFCFLRKSITQTLRILELSPMGIPKPVWLLLMLVWLSPVVFRFGDLEGPASSSGAQGICSHTGLLSPLLTLSSFCLHLPFLSVRPSVIYTCELWWQTPCSQTILGSAEPPFLTWMKWSTGVWILSSLFTQPCRSELSLHTRQQTTESSQCLLIHILTFLQICLSLLWCLFS